MFDKKSDYALNRRNKDSIIYMGTIGLIRLTCEDFPTEAEFLLEALVGRRLPQYGKDRARLL